MTKDVLRGILFVLLQLIIEVILFIENFSNNTMKTKLRFDMGGDTQVPSAINKVCYDRKT